jgi:hypothetical protein
MDASGSSATFVATYLSEMHYYRCEYSVLNGKEKKYYRPITILTLVLSNKTDARSAVLKNYVLWNVASCNLVHIQLSFVPHYLTSRFGRLYFLLQIFAFFL